MDTGISQGFPRSPIKTQGLFALFQNVFSKSFGILLAIPAPRNSLPSLFGAIPHATFDMIMWLSTIALSLGFQGLLKKLVLRGTKLKSRSFPKFSGSVSFMFRKFQTESTLIKFSMIPRQVKLAPGPGSSRTLDHSDAAAVPPLTAVIHLLSFDHVFSYPNPHGSIGLPFLKRFDFSFDA